MSYRPVPTTEEELVNPRSDPAKARQFKSPTRILLAVSTLVLVFLGFQLGKWYSSCPEPVDQSYNKNVTGHSVDTQTEIPDTEMSPHEKRSVA